MNARQRFASLAAGIALGAWGIAASATDTFVNFESGHVRPLALSPGGDQLFAVNTPDNRLTIYDIGAGGELTLAGEVAVGLEPVAVAVRTGAGGRPEAWVVNHLSDSVSIVEIDPLGGAGSRVIRTLLVGDEPRDIVFAGSAGNRAFVSAAHRGQNRPGDPRLLTEGVGRADVWVFDADALGAPLGGTPLTIVELFGDTPRALAASADGRTVYAAVFASGNRTTSMNRLTVGANGGLPPAPPGALPDAPAVGLIVQYNLASGRWEDEILRDWSTQVPFSLPDKDVFLIDADADPPAPAGGGDFVTDVGTVLFNMAVRPGASTVYVSNTEARNAVRFEPVLQGHLVESRVTVIDGATATAHHLNPHIDFGVPTGPPAEVAQSLAFPQGLAFSSDGQTLYLAAMGSATVAALDADALEGGTVAGTHIAVGRGPTGLVLHAPSDTLYVMNRIDHSISLVDPVTEVEVGIVPLPYDPSPITVTAGRPFLYDARTTSGHGDNACASCHVFGDTDHLAWDLGNPFGDVVQVGQFSFHPMKGPMGTQSLRGMQDAGSMHWRGDRSGGSDPGGDPFDEVGAFGKFNPAFVDLMGRAAELSSADMQAFTDFALTLRYPPNPNRPLDGTLTLSQALGEQDFKGGPALLGCHNCHALPLGTNTQWQGGDPFGVGVFKVPHLRNIYQKVGMFGTPQGINPRHVVGDQIRGFGVAHDGSISTLTDFHFFFSGNTDNLDAFILAFDTGLAPAVGQQVSATPATRTDPGVLARRDLLIARAEAADCDLIARTTIAGESRGALYVAGLFYPDRHTDSPLPVADLHALAATSGQEVTYTCVPPRSGVRMALDRDEDGYFDRSELDDGTDPNDAASAPPGPPPSPPLAPDPVLVRTTALLLKDEPLDERIERRRFVFRSITRGDPASNRVTPPVVGGPGDPTLHGAVVTVYNAAGASEDEVTLLLPAAAWRVIGTGKGFVFADPSPTRDGPIKRAVIRDDRLVLRGGKQNWTYTLDESRQERVGVRLRLGGAPGWCAESTPKVDKRELFRGNRQEPPPSVCPAAP
jgi:DNA-binding beta-propeller fold protein YncE